MMHEFSRSRDPEFASRAGATVLELGSRSVYSKPARRGAWRASCCHKKPVGRLSYTPLENSIRKTGTQETDYEIEGKAPKAFGTGERVSMSRNQPPRCCNVAPLQSRRHHHPRKAVSILNWRSAAAGI